MIQELWNGLVAFITVFAIALFAASIASYRRARTPRLMFITAGFGLFAVKGLILTTSLFLPLALPLTLLSAGIADAGILGLLFVASVRPT